MKSEKNHKSVSSKLCNALHPLLKSILIITLSVTGFQISLRGQTPLFERPAWTFGIAGAANYNTSSGTTQQLSTTFRAPVPFRGGDGVGLFLAPVIQYHHPDAIWGFMLQSGFDSRKSSFNTKTAPTCNCPADLFTDLGYITVEPSFRVAPFKSGFHLFGGPRLAFNLNKEFTYEENINPDLPEQNPDPKVTGEFSDIKSVLLSMQVGAGYDFYLSSQQYKTQFVVSPFIAFHPYAGQAPRSVENWEVTTLRLGAAIKVGHGQRIPVPPAITEVMVTIPEFTFSVYSPKNDPVELNISETFPLRNYVFFDTTSTKIPDRYVLLNKSQAKDFKEDSLELFVPKNLWGRSMRQMQVYYNVINILGVRMVKDTDTSIKLVGSSYKDPADGKAMAESIKNYLVNIFGINASRISTEGRSQPKIPSVQPGGTLELDLLLEGDRRVSIESSSASLLMEYQNGPDAPLKPVYMPAAKEAPLSSYVNFNVGGANEAFSSWSLEVKDEKGMVQYFGPYTQEKIRISGKSILGTRPQGDYIVTMVGQTKNGNVVRRETPVHVVLWTPSKHAESMRYSILYEFNVAEANALYERYLTEVVTPKIPIGGKVHIHGHTDTIGEEDYNQTLSLARANDARSIIEKALSKEGRSDVIFEVYGLGEDPNWSPFDNNYPEERAYNRTVIMDIIPPK